MHINYYLTDACEVIYNYYITKVPPVVMRTSESLYLERMYVGT